MFCILKQRLGCLMENNNSNFSDKLENLNDDNIQEIIVEFENDPAYSNLLALLRHPFDEG